MAQNNTYKHISDESKYSTFNPAGTQYPQTVKNVQEALALTSPTSPATEQEYGVIKLATMAQVMAGTDDTTAVTPLKLGQRLQHPDATTSQRGIIQIATNAQAVAGSDTNKAIVSSSLKYVVDWLFANRLSTEIATGVIKLSTEAAAVAGTDNTTAMTPLRVKQAIAEATKLIPSYTTATENVAGLVQLATAGQVQQGTLRAGVAVSPYSLAQLTGNETRRGIVQAATLAQANAGTDQSVYISAAGFKSFNANTTNFGTVKLTDVPGQGGAGAALSTNAQVVRLTGDQTINGNISITGSLTTAGKHVVTEDIIDDHMPIGAVMMWSADTLPSAKWAVCDGGDEQKNSRAVLFQRIGYKYGGGGEVFKRPDMRGLFVRGAGTGKHILDERGIDSKGKPLLGNGCDGGSVGQVQKQQITEHKHATGWGERYTGNEARYGRSAGTGYYGSAKSDWDNFMYFTNDSNEIEPEERRSAVSTLNRKNLIGEENRPWNMSLYYIIKVA